MIEEKNNLNSPDDVLKKHLNELFPEFKQKSGFYCFTVDAMREYALERSPLFANGMCGVCGGGLVSIRGKYPKDEMRAVCPTCTTERLEHIHDISSKSYGMASSESITFLPGAVKEG